MAKCATIWCDHEAIARGLCGRCYARVLSGTSLATPGRPHTTAADRERLRSEVIRRRKAGETLPDISAAVGVDRTVLRRWLREWDVPAAPRRAPRPVNASRPWSAEDIEFAVGRTDLSIPERAEALGRTISGVEEIIRRRRLGLR